MKDRQTATEPKDTACSHEGSEMKSKIGQRSEAKVEDWTEIRGKVGIVPANCMQGKQ